MDRPPDSKTAAAILHAYTAFSTRAGRIGFLSPVEYVYNPIQYCRAPFTEYVCRYATGRRRVLFLGMNPGPWGMAQTGVPFGEVGLVRDWLHIQETAVGHPAREHPRVPVRGFSCTRSEVSGSRFWGLMKSRFPRASVFFKNSFVANYCPLLFLDKDGRNLTPDKISRQDRELLFSLCDSLFLSLMEALAPRLVVGIGAFAMLRIRAAIDPGAGIAVAALPHPSPASPQANRDWAGQAERILSQTGIW